MSQFKENGKLNTVFLPSLLIDIYKDQKNGSLELDSSSNLKIYFDKGTPFYAEGGDEETLLANLLLKENKISDTQYEEIKNKIETTESRVGEIIMNMGILNPHELNEYLELQIKEKIIRGLLYTDGDYKFEDMTEFPSGIFYCSLDLNTIITETLRRYVNISEIDIDQLKLHVSPELGNMLSKLNLGPKELRTAQLLTKGTKLSAIAGPDSPDRERNIILVFFLALYDYVDLENFSVVDFCKKAFIKQHKKEQTDIDKHIDSSEHEDNIPLIELEDEITENKAEIPDEGLEIKTDEADTDLTLHTQTDFESDFNSETEGVDIKVDDQDNQLNNKIPEDKLTDNETTSEVYQTSGQEGLEINADEQDTDNVTSEEAVGSGSVTTGTESNDFENQEGIEIEAAIQDQSEPALTNNAGDSSTDKKSEKDNESELINEITEFYEFVSEEEDSFGILGIGKDSTDSEVKEAYFTLVKKFHPDANPNFPKEIRSKAETIFTKVTQAYENLSSRDKRESYESLKEVHKVKDKAQSIYDAEILYTEGELLLRQRRYKEACEKFFHAIELNPEEAAYIGALSWARFLSYENKNSIIRNSVKELEKATSMDDTVAQNFYYLGSVYKFMNDTNKAEKNFQKAVELDPHYIQAKRELRLIQSRKQNRGSKEKGNNVLDGNFWSGLFKK